MAIKITRCMLSQCQCTDCALCTNTNIF